MAWATRSDSGIVISKRSGTWRPWKRAMSGLRRSTPEKKAAIPQNSSWVQVANGWSWHWAHSSRIPMKTREAPAASSPGSPCLAARKAKGEGSISPRPKTFPCWPSPSGTVSSSRTIASKPASSLNCLRSQGPNAMAEKASCWSFSTPGISSLLQVSVMCWT